MPKNFGKIMLAIALELSIFTSIMIIVSFITQICVQLGLNKLGFYILIANSATGIVIALFGPAFFVRFRAKRILVLASFGTAYARVDCRLWVAGNVLPVACANPGAKNLPICTPTFISVFMISLSIIGGACMGVSLGERVDELAGTVHIHRRVV